MGFETINFNVFKIINFNLMMILTGCFIFEIFFMVHVWAGVLSASVYVWPTRLCELCLAWPEPGASPKVRYKVNLVFFK